MSDRRAHHWPSRTSCCVACLLTICAVAIAISCCAIHGASGAKSDASSAPKQSQTDQPDASAIPEPSVALSLDLPSGLHRVQSIAWLPSSREFAVEHDGTVSVFRVSDMRELLRIQVGGECEAAHARSSWLSVNPSGTRIAYGRREVPAQLFDLKTGARVGSFGSGIINGIFSTDDQLVAVTHGETTLRHSGSAASSALDNGYTPGAATLSRDGRKAAFGDRGAVHIVGMMDSGQRRIIGVETGATTSQPQALAFDPDAKWLATAFLDGPVRILDVTSGSPIASLATEARTFRVAFTPDGRRLVTVTTRGIIQEWNTQDWHVVRSRNTRGTLTDSLLSPDGRLLLMASSDGTRLLEVSNEMSLPAPPSQSEKRRVQTVQFAGPTSIALGFPDQNGGATYVFEGLPGAEPRRIPHAVAAFTLDGNLMAWRLPRGLQLLRTRTGETVRWLDGATDTSSWADPQEGVVALSADASMVALATGPILQVYSSGTGAELWKIEAGIESGTTTPIFSVDGSRLAYVRKALDNRSWLVVADAGTGRTLEKTPDTYHAEVAFHGSRARFVLGGSEAVRTASLYELDSGRRRVLWTRSETDANRFLFNSDATVLATASTRVRYDGCVDIALWNASDGRELMRLPFSDGLDGWAFSPNGRLFVASSAAGSVRVWHWETGQLIGMLRMVDGSDTGYAFVPGSDGRIEFFGPARGNLPYCSANGLAVPVEACNHRFEFPGWWGRVLNAL